jgi:hypothetical protein
MTRLGSWLAPALCAPALIAAGCGSHVQSRPVAAHPLRVWMDSGLRGVVSGGRIGSTPVTVTYARSDRLLDRLARGRRPDVLVVENDFFPSWDEHGDRMRDSRIVATDPLMLVSRKPDPVPGGLAGLGRGLAVPRTGAAGAAARRLLSDPRERPRDRHPRFVRTATDVLQALRSGRAVAGIVPRSVLRHAADRAQFGATRIPFDGIFVQTAYAAGRPAGEQVVRWLASAAGRARFAAAGFGRPGPDARPIDCPADISKPCRERPGP